MLGDSLQNIKSAVSAGGGRVDVGAVYGCVFVVVERWGGVAKQLPIFGLFFPV